MKYSKENSDDILKEFGYVLFSKGAYAKSISSKCLSNFYPVEIIIKDQIFTCSEQIFMSYKAKYFKANKILKDILDADYDPFNYKKLGNSRKINFIDEEWKKVRVYFMYKSIKFKFKNNPKMKEYLLSTGNSLLVECNQYDKYWSCGLNESNFKKSKKASSWSGDNLLGFLLMELRDELRE